MSLRATLPTILTITAAWTSAPPLASSLSRAADVIYRNGSIYTVNADFKKVSAVAVKNGYISAVGSDSSESPHLPIPVSSLR